MLGADYFNGTRLNTMKAMCDQFRKYGGSYFDLKNRTVNISREDLLVDFEVYNRFVTCYPQYEVCFLAFTSGVTCSPYSFSRSNIGNGKQCFSYQRTSDSYRKEYDIDFKIMGAFMQAKMYTDLPQYDEFDKLVKFGDLLSYDLPRARGLLDDGQCKILFDVIGAIDDLDLSVEHKVVVVGSSHPGISEGGIAYDVFPSMGLKGTVDLYDPYNEDIVEKKDGLTMVYHQALYEYPHVEGDVLLDDAWQEGLIHSDFDPGLVAYQYANYSIKKFPFEYYEYGGSIYKQVFRTEGKEQRYVSRSLSWNYRNLPIGDCPACIELKFHLKQDYGPDFYTYWMNSHKVNCVTKIKRDLIVPVKCVSIEDFIEVEEVDVRSIPKLFTTPWDNMQYPKVVLDAVKLRNSVVVTRSLSNISPRIYHLSPMVLLVDQYVCRAHKRFCQVCVCPHKVKKKCDKCFYGPKRTFSSSHRKEMGVIPVSDKLRVEVELEDRPVSNAYKIKTGHYNPKNKEEVWRIKHDV